jgi:hypothetical protein
VTRRIPVEVHTVLSTHIDSLEKVELAWHLNNAGGRLPDGELQKRTQLDANIFREAIDALTHSLVLQRVDDGSIAFGPRARTSEFDALMRFYTEDRLGVIAELMSISIARIRHMAAQTFAEAFVLKKKR